MAAISISLHNVTQLEAVPGEHEGCHWVDLNITADNNLRLVLFFEDRQTAADYVAAINTATIVEPATEEAA